MDCIPTREVLRLFPGLASGLSPSFSSIAEAKLHSATLKEAATILALGHVILPHVSQFPDVLDSDNEALISYQLCNNMRQVPGSGSNIEDPWRGVLLRGGDARQKTLGRCGMHVWCRYGSGIAD